MIGGTRRNQSTYSSTLDEVGARWAIGLDYAHFDPYVEVHSLLTLGDSLAGFSLIIVVLGIRARMALLSFMIIDLLVWTTNTCLLGLVEMIAIRAFVTFLCDVIVDILWRTGVTFHFLSAVEGSGRTFLAFVIGHLLGVFGTVLA